MLWPTRVKGPQSCFRKLAIPIPVAAEGQAFAEARVFAGISAGSLYDVLTCTGQCWKEARWHWEGSKEVRDAELQENGWDFRKSSGDVSLNLLNCKHRWWSWLVILCGSRKLQALGLPFTRMPWARWADGKAHNSRRLTLALQPACSHAQQQPIMCLISLVQMQLQQYGFPSMASLWRLSHRLGI